MRMFIVLVMLLMISVCGNANAYTPNPINQAKCERLTAELELLSKYYAKATKTTGRNSKTYYNEAKKPWLKQMELVKPMVEEMLRSKDIDDIICIYMISKKYN